MKHLVMVVSYEGTAYEGFQTQPSGNTVQDKLQDALWHLTGERIEIEASGRTDAGVHALAQVFHFATNSRIPLERWCLALNGRLPDDIVVRSAEETTARFHARFSAVSKTYRYSIRRSRWPNEFTRRTEFHHPTPLDVERMREALAHFIGEHDFTSFCSARTPVGSHVRTIYDARIEFVPEGSDYYGGAGVIHIYITGSGFLQHMVRIIVGTLMDVGEGKRSSDSMPAILAAKDRRRAGPTAMAHGLTMMEVKY